MPSVSMHNTLKFIHTERVSKEFFTALRILKYLSERKIIFLKAKRRMNRHCSGNSTDGNLITFVW